jgi:hypothetical protein
MDRKGVINRVNQVFENVRYEPPAIRLPGYTPRERMFEGVVDFIPEYHIGHNEIAIRDPVWGECLIENKGYDRIWFELARNPLVQRSLAIEQLTLSPDFSTIPNTGHFSRWEHIWGSVVFVRRMIEDHGQDWELDDRQKIILQLRTFVSDLGHTAFSHLGDWMFQGKGGKENQHDEELAELLEASGIADILRQYDITIDEVVFPNIVDWIEAPSPDLCTDRVDYGLREMNRWQKLITNMWMMKYPEMFTVTDDGQLVMANEQAARRFARGFAILPTEHWGEPVHRLQLQLLEQLVKRSFTNDHQLHGESLGFRRRHPRQWMYAIDDDFITNMQTSDRFMWVVQDMMRSIGQQQRNIFVTSRMEGVGAFLQGRQPFPVPGQKLSGWHGHFPQHANNVDLIPVLTPEDVDDFERNPYTVDVFLPPLKPRLVKPKYIGNDGQMKQLDEQDEEMAAVYCAQQLAMQQAYVARIVTTAEYKKIIERGIKFNEERWAELLTLPRLEPDEFQRLIGSAALSSVMSHGMVSVSWDR